VTDDYCVFGLFGPKSRDLIKTISNENFENDNFKFGTGKYIIIENIKIWTQRLSYVGELGYELYVEFKDAKKIYELIINKGKDFNLSNCGVHAMDIMRMESGYLHWGHDISPKENQYEAGLNFAISFKKDVNFLGKDVLLKMKDKKPNKRLVMLTLKNNKPGEPLLLHDEPIYLDDKIIGETTSGNFSFNFNKNLSFGYIKSNLGNEELFKKNIYIEIEKKKHLAEILPKPLKQSNFKTI
jgi:4-methylaminobutanoate oxidase (formaldehyde-forming)